MQTQLSGLNRGSPNSVARLVSEQSDTSNAAKIVSETSFEMECQYVLGSDYRDGMSRGRMRIVWVPHLVKKA